MNIIFHPTLENTHFIKETKIYQNLWDSEKENILTSIKNVSDLDLYSNETIHSIISTGNFSTAYPFVLMDYPTLEEKQTNLIHELLHRLLGKYNLSPQSSVKRAEYLSSQGYIERATENHKRLDLIFYDILVDVYGFNVADRCVMREKKRGVIYKDAWKWALSFSKEERAKKFQELITSTKKAQKE